MLIDFLGSGHPIEHWRPATDVYRTREGWLLKLELAGIRPDEVEVRVERGRLVVVGTRRDLHLGEEHECHALEISYTRFQRAFDLPADLERAAISTDYRDGMLLVRVAVGAAR